MIDQIIPFTVVTNALPVNVAPSNFNPIPADGILEIWAALDAIAASGDFPAAIQVTLGGATPSTPVPLTAIRVNQFAEPGAGPSPGDVVMSRQGVRQGTNLQILLSGGTGGTQNGRIRVKFTSAEELASGIGAVTS